MTGTRDDIRANEQGNAPWDKQRIDGAIGSEPRYSKLPSEPFISRKPSDLEEES